jgi:hypothetical protein
LIVIARKVSAKLATIWFEELHRLHTSAPCRPERVKRGGGNAGPEGVEKSGGGPTATRVTGRFGPRASKLATSKKAAALFAATLFSDVANGTQVNKEAA